MQTQDLEARIEEAAEKMVAAGLRGDIAEARKWSREMTDLIGMRGPERVWRMEREKGLR